MRVLKRILFILVAAVIVLSAAAYLLPRNVIVTRSIVIDAPAFDVFPYVNSLKAGAEWSPWLHRDPDAKLTYSGPDTGVGATLTWASDHPQVGNGREEIVESVKNELVLAALDFGDQGSATAAFRLVEAADKTALTWDMNADMGNSPIGRYMGLMMDKWVGADYETGLANLKALIEVQ